MVSYEDESVFDPHAPKSYTKLVNDKWGETET